MMKINLLLAVFNALCVPVNLWFYFYGSGLTASLVVAVANAIVAVLCAQIAYKCHAPYGDNGGSR